MSRDHKKILQVPSPTDNSLKRFITTLFEENCVSSVKVKIGILTPRVIKGILENDPDIEEAQTIEIRNLDAVKADIETVFDGTSATSVSTHRIEFHRSGQKFCTFERVRTVPIQIMTNNGGAIQYHSTPDYRVAEFYFDRDVGPEAAAFNSALSAFLRPIPGDDSGEGGPDGLNAVLSRMSAVTAGMMDDLAKSQLA